MKHLLAVVLALLASINAAFAGLEDLNFHSYTNGEYVLGIMATDQRPYVLSGETPANVAGAYIKGIFRIRAHIKTDTEEPVASEITNGLRKGFEKNKWLGVATIPTTKDDTAEDRTSLVKTAKLRRTLVVAVDDMWAESYRNTSVTYKFTITILDDKAKELARSEATGTHDTREWGCDGAAEILGQVLTATLAKPEFIAALK